MTKFSSMNPLLVSVFHIKLPISCERLGDAQTSCNFSRTTTNKTKHQKIFAICCWYWKITTMKENSSFWTKFPLLLWCWNPWEKFETSNYKWTSFTNTSRIYWSSTLFLFVAVPKRLGNFVAKHIAENGHLECRWESSIFLKRLPNPHSEWHVSVFILPCETLFRQNTQGKCIDVWICVSFHPAFGSHSNDLGIIVYIFVFTLLGFCSLYVSFCLGALFFAFRLIGSFLAFLFLYCFFLVLFLFTAFFSVPFRFTLHENEEKENVSSCFVKRRAENLDILDNWMNFQLFPNRKHLDPHVHSLHLPPFHHFPNCHSTLRHQKTHKVARIRFHC